MTDQVDNNQAATNSQAEPAQFAIQRIYVKDISFEAPNLPELFTVDFKPEVKMEMNSKSRLVAENNYEVVLTITLKAESADKTAFLAEVHQAGIFFIKGFNDQQVHQLLGAAAPEALYPYVRETIASLIGRSGFPSIQIAPVNFMGLYMQRMAQAQAEAKAAAENAEAAASETVQ